MPRCSGGCDATFGHFHCLFGRCYKLVRADLQSARYEYRDLQSRHYYNSALQMLIFYAGGLQIRQNNTTQQTERCRAVRADLWQHPGISAACSGGVTNLFGRICNPPATDIGICNPDIIIIAHCKCLYSMLADCKSARTIPRNHLHGTAHPTEHRSDRPFDKKSCLMLASLQKKSYL